MLGVDAAGHPDPSSCVQAGYSLVGQYLGGANATSPAYVQQVTEANAGLFSIWEVGARAAANGAGQGVIDAQAALTRARALGQPKGSVIYFTADFQPASDEMANVVGYFRATSTAVRQDGYLGGAYGGTETLNAVQGIVDVGWQSNAWTNGVQLPWVAMRQRLQQTTVAGTTCDIDDVINPPVGAWNLNGLWPSDPPTPPNVYPGDHVQSQTVEVVISGGHGWFASPVNAANIVSVAALTENPDVVGRYDHVPVSWAMATSPGPNSPNGAITVTGPADGTWGLIVWSVTP